MYIISRQRVEVKSRSVIHEVGDAGGVLQHFSLPSHLQHFVYGVGILTVEVKFAFSEDILQRLRENYAQKRLAVSC